MHFIHMQLPTDITSKSYDTLYKYQQVMELINKSLPDDVVAFASPFPNMRYGAFEIDNEELGGLSDFEIQEAIKRLVDKGVVNQSATETMVDDDYEEDDDWDDEYDDYYDGYYDEEYDEEYDEDDKEEHTSADLFKRSIIDAKTHLESNSIIKTKEDLDNHINSQKDTPITFSNDKELMDFVKYVIKNLEN